MKYTKITSLLISAFCCTQLLAQSLFNIYPAEDGQIFPKVLETETGYLLEINNSNSFDEAYKYLTINEQADLIATENIELNVPDGVFPSRLRLSNGNLLLGWADGTSNQLNEEEKSAYLRTQDENGNILKEASFPLPTMSRGNTGPAVLELPDGTFFIFMSYGLVQMSSTIDERYFIYMHYDLENDVILSQNEFLYSDNFSRPAATSLNLASDGNVFLKFWDIEFANQHYMKKIQVDGVELWSENIASLERPVTLITPSTDGGVWFYIDAFEVARKLDADGNSVGSFNVFNFFDQDNTAKLQALAPTLDGGVLMAAANSSTLTNERFTIAKISSTVDVEYFNRYAFPNAAPTTEVNFSSGIRKADNTFAFAGSFGQSANPKIPFLLTLNENGNFVTPAEVDLEISLSGTTTDPGIWTTHQVRLTIENNGGADATGIEVSIPKPMGEKYQGGNEYLASQGIFDVYGSLIWTVGNLAAGAVATIDINYFKVSADGFFQYAQVVSQNEAEEDSTPNNGNGAMANEDDEAVFGAGFGEPCGNDTQAPLIISCVPNINVTTSSVPYEVSWSEPEVIDDCGSVLSSANFQSGHSFPEGTTFVEYIFSDAAGNESSCEFAVTVILDSPAGPCEDNLLQYPGFEIGFNQFIWKSSGSVAATSASYSGETGMLLFSGSTGGQIFQTVAALPGLSYDLAAYARNSDPEESGFIYIKFLAADFQVLDKVTKDIASTEFALATLSSIAPAGTAYVQVGVQKYGGPNVVYADEWCLTGDEGDPGNDLADLILSDITAPETGSVGEILNYQFSLRNMGEAPAVGDFSIKAYFSTDAVLSNDDAFDGEIVTGNLAAGQLIENVNGASIIPALPPGDYYLILKVDAENEIEESNENNNLLATPIYIEGDGSLYCEVESDFPWHEWISEFDINNQVNFTSGKSKYSDFTEDANVATVEQGGSVNYNFTITYSYFTYDAFARLYIDYNGNGFFEETEYSETLISAVPAFKYAEAVGVGTIEVPVDAQVGITRARLIVSREPIVDACTDLAFGEIEDYLVNINAGGVVENKLDVEIKSNLLAFPNPANQLLYIHPGSYSGMATLRLYNALGKTVREISLPESDLSNGQQVEMNLANLSSGPYWLARVEASGETETTLITVQH